jgi:AcrR family transcriptional regulator
MTKGSDTKNSILEVGLEMASQLGLEDVTIGSLAKKMGMSKSGIFGHFQSKENLQLQIVQYAVEDFTQFVVLSSLKVKGGIPRIKAVVDKWISWGNNLKGGCIFVSASNEFSDRPGHVRDALMDYQNKWLDSLEKLALSAIKAGDFREGIDTKQFTFELYSLLLGFHYYHQMLKDSKILEKEEKALDRLIQNYQ